MEVHQQAVAVVNQQAQVHKTVSIQEQPGISVRAPAVPNAALWPSLMSSLSSILVVGATQS